MFDIINLGNNTETTGRRARTECTRCARACDATRRSFLRACAGFLFLSCSPLEMRRIGSDHHQLPPHGAPSRTDAPAHALQLRSERPRAWLAAASRAIAAHLDHPRVHPTSSTGISNFINPHQPESSQSLQQPSTARIISHQPALVLPVHSIARPLSSCCRELSCMASDHAYICCGVRDVAAARVMRAAPEMCLRSLFVFRFSFLYTEHFVASTQIPVKPYPHCPAKLLPLPAGEGRGPPPIQGWARIKPQSPISH